MIAIVATGLSDFVRWLLRWKAKVSCFDRFFDSKNAHKKTRIAAGFSFEFQDGAEAGLVDFPDFTRV